MILKIIFPQFCEVIAEGLAAGKELLITAETAIQRVATSVDNPGIRQGKMQQAGVDEVVGVLINKSRQATAIFFCATKVLIA